MRSWILIPAENDKAIAAAAGSGAGAIVIDLARPLAPGLQAAARMAASAWLRAHREQVVAERRFERWEVYPEPALEDWLELLDGVRRRIPRRKMEPADENRLVRTIKEKFPDQKDRL